jgi:superfamily II DNA or RNA helicase
MLDQKRNEIQDITVETWFQTGCKGTANVSTGVGKTFIFFKALLKTCKVGDRILFLAETRQREIDLFVDLEKFERLFNVNLRQYNIQFDCYQSAYKWTNTQWDMVCADEIHSGLSPVYSKFFFNNSIKRILGLSATVDRNTLYVEEGVEYTKGDLLDKIAPVVFTYTLNQAAEDGTTKKLNIYIIRHTMDALNKNVPAGTKANPFMTTEQAAYDYWDGEFRRALFLPDGQAKTFRIRNTSAARAKVLYNLPSKIQSASKLIQALHGKTLLFGNSLEALHKVTPNVIHGKNSEKKNSQIRKDFDEGVITCIGSFKMLKQGANLKDLDNTVIMSYYSKELDLIQQLGRQRVTDKTGNVFIYLTVGSQEVKWLEKAMSNITNYNILTCNGEEEAIQKYLENQQGLEQ